MPPLSTFHSPDSRSLALADSWKHSDLPAGTVKPKDAARPTRQPRRSRHLCDIPRSPTLRRRGCVAPHEFQTTTGTAGYFPGYSSTSRDATLWVGVVGSMSACGIRSGSAALIRVHESRMGLEATSAGFPLYEFERRGGVLASKKDQARR